MKKGNGRQSRDVRREQIVRAALAVIARKGVSGLTTAVLAKEVGISEANLYRHFRSKDEILSETGKAVGEAIRKNLESALKTSDVPLVKLKKAFMLHLEYIEKNEGIPRLGFSEEMHVSNAKLKKLFRNNIELYSAGLASIVREGQRSGSIRTDVDPAALASLIIGAVQVTVMRWSLSGFSFSLTKVGRKLWKDIEQCFTAAPSAPGRKK
jgi:AcrR family transcriptional regulator